MALLLERARTLVGKTLEDLGRAIYDYPEWALVDGQDVKLPSRLCEAQLKLEAALQKWGTVYNGEVLVGIGNQEEIRAIVRGKLNIYGKDNRIFVDPEQPISVEDICFFFGTEFEGKSHRRKFVFPPMTSADQPAGVTIFENGAALSEPLSGKILQRNIENFERFFREGRSYRLTPEIAKDFLNNYLNMKEARTEATEEKYFEEGTLSAGATC